MKYSIKFILTLFFALFSISTNAAAQTAKLELKSFIPTPHFDAMQLRLNPKPKPVPCLEGTVFLDIDNNNQLTICDNNGDSYFISPAWTYDPATDNVYKTVYNSGNVGVGAHPIMIPPHNDFTVIGNLAVGGIFGSGDDLFNPNVIIESDVLNGPTMFFWPKKSAFGASNYTTMTTAAIGNGSVVLGGQGNVASADLSVVLGGSSNTNSGFNSLIIGGTNNTIIPSGSPFGDWSTIIGGFTTNSITGGQSMILNGSGATINGGGSVLIGIGLLGGTETIDQDYTTVIASNTIGIGTFNTTTIGPERLYVNGNVKMGTEAHDFAASAEDNVRLISGKVDQNGVIEAGNGFTVVRNSAGNYTITYDLIDPPNLVPDHAAFDGTITMPVITPVTTGVPVPVFFMITSANNSSFTAQSLQIPTLAPTDSAFNFFVTGDKYVP